PEVFVHGGDWLGDFLTGNKVITQAGGHAVSHATEYALMGISTALMVIMIIAAWIIYRKYKEEKETGLSRLLANKWYVDELYDAIIVKRLPNLGGFFRSVFENSVIDGIVKGVGRMVNYGSRLFRLLQSGQVGNYILLMVVSIVLIFAVQFFL